MNTSHVVGLVGSSSRRSHDQDNNSPYARCSKIIEVLISVTTDFRQHAKLRSCWLMGLQEDWGPALDQVRPVQTWRGLHSSDGPTQCVSVVRGWLVVRFIYLNVVVDSCTSPLPPAPPADHISALLHPSFKQKQAKSMFSKYS
jgi:hypothetical protein